METSPNDPARAGQLASRPTTFGPFSRYKVAAVHTRFDAVSFFVWDAELLDELTGLPAVVRQESTRELAMRDLATEEAA